ncbi:hypothetical protein WH87_12880 [Devosia epidermidihirudinis]|uniref:ATPase BadF/BadG/BcrA/BcrD type domain-containing protein n=1 Tax=Devosia epidermidihirudinis TaxID=1293439 RepID=A0A0F5Q9H5_9HYPH|nr:BadF/BadG/BcrA/BcrD ATPase family protein [Devosia epidermidihirudinis]KKC37418.1 hypothetical protein WH87_12880 [Devosia epidermidihirudinis]
MNNQLVVGIDIGGTKTHLIAANGESDLAEHVVRTAEWRVADVQSNAISIRDLVQSLCREETPTAVAVGAHGCDTDWHCDQLQAALATVLSCPVRVVNDCELLIPAAGFSAGIGVVSGTGSIAVSRSATGNMLAAGGWGWLLGDEGSAPTLVRDAARAVRASIDHGLSDDPLIAMLLGALGIDDPIKLGRRLYEMGDGVVWGQQAPVVFEAAEAGSRLATMVVSQAGEALAELVTTLVGRGADARHVVAGGGVIVQQPRLMEAFHTAMAKKHPSSRVTLLDAAPVKGALTLARRLSMPNAHT